MWDYFLFPKIEGHPNKADMILRTIEELQSIGHEIGEVIYVDDRTLHVDEVFLKIHFIYMWMDVKGLDELKKLLEGL
ncbi:MULTISPECIES: hypothetical protein [unclassified Thermococcus]|uniref:hypothetical protein n=1 Tax=unclassified Thermococcus TaxID=2627626 RepID=UPI001F104713|nr:MULTISPECIES: hypothetical protein [unclassified Thermococcus]